MADHPYRSESRPPNEREDEALAELSVRVVRARGLIAGACAIIGLCAGVAVYLAVVGVLVVHYPYYTMAAVMLLALGGAFTFARWAGRRWVAARMPLWVAELSEHYGVERRRLDELSTIWS
jgi:hypothetical protein